MTIEGRKETDVRFDSYHPMINLIYFAGAIVCAVTFNHPVFLAITYLASFCYSVKLNGKRSLLFNLVLIPLIFMYAFYYSGYHHFGITVLKKNFIGNQMTLEALVTGYVRGTAAASVLMICGCIFAVFSSDKVVYLFGRISPKLSLFLSILLRFVPRVKKRAAGIETARRGAGKGCTQGNLFRRAAHVVSLLSVLVTWTAEDFVESAASMKSRGYSLKGRTSFSIYRFDNRDRCVVLLFAACLTVTGAAVLFQQTTILYSPEIVWNRITPFSFFFYAVYAFFLFLPMLLQMAGESKYRMAVRKNID